jgi:hypothetical protein
MGMMNNMPEFSVCQNCDQSIELVITESLTMWVHLNHADMKCSKAIPTDKTNGDVKK